MPQYAGVISKKLTIGCVLLLSFAQAGLSQDSVAATTATGPTGLPGQVSRVTNNLFNLLTMAGTNTAADFRPLTQEERTHIYLKSLINPFLYVTGAFSAALDQWNDKPEEWEQGASGYGKRFANVMGQYGVEKTAMFGLSSLLHEDNRYFGSGKKGFWKRTGYALSSGFLARHDNGKRYPSISLMGGYATGAFVSRTWQPNSTSSAGDGARVFGLSMGYNAFGGVVKEFLPDVVRHFNKGRKAGKP